MERAKDLRIHAAIDKNQNILALRVWPGSTADAHATNVLLRAVKTAHPNTIAILGDTAYGGEPLEWLAAELRLSIDANSLALLNGKTFHPLPVRWRLEQFFSWLAKKRRIAPVWAYGLVGFVRGA